MMAVPYIELAEAKQYLNLTATTDDDELSRFVTSACRAVERYRDETIGLDEYTETFDLNRSVTAVHLAYKPIITLESVTNASTEWDTDTLRVHRPTGTLETTDSTFTGLLVVVYTAGYETVPDDWRHATLVLIDHLWTTQRRATIGRRALGDDDSGYNPAMSYSLPHRVCEMLGTVPTGIA
jgi:hypothetical protein